MKKITIVLMVALLLSACGQKKAETPTQVMPTKTVANTVFSTIKDALTKNLTLKCIYADDKGVNYEAYLQGQMVAMNGVGTTGDQVEGLMKDGWWYIWDATKKQGMKLDVAKMAADGSWSIKGKQIKSVDNVASALEGDKQNCQVVTGVDSKFVVPGDVTFQSASDLLK